MKARNRRKHGHCRRGKKSITYVTWQCMKARCLNPNHVRYPDYGGAGITLARRWLSFKNFFRDMGRRPSRKHTLDRIDPTKGYSKKNCRWATPKQQAKNRRKRGLERTLTREQWHELGW